MPSGTGYNVREEEAEVSLSDLESEMAEALDSKDLNSEDSTEEDK